MVNEAADEGDHKTIRAEIFGHEKNSDERWLGHQREHELLNRATDVAATTLDKRVQALNEFRAQLGDQAKSFVTRDLHDKLETDLVRSVDVLRERVISLEKGDVKAEGRGLGQAGTIAAGIAIVAFAGLVLSIMLNVVTLLNH